MTSRSPHSGTLLVDAGPDRVPVEVRDKQLRLVHEGTSDQEFDLPAGTYLVTALFPGVPGVVDTAQIEAGSTVTASLPPPAEASAPTPRMRPLRSEGRRAAGSSRRAIDAVEAELTLEGEEAEEATWEGAERIDEVPERRWWLRFTALQNLSEAAPTADVSIDRVEQQGSTTLIHLQVVGGVGRFAVLGADDQVPLNVALPAAGWASSTACVLSADASSGQLYVGAFPENERVRLASRYLAAGDVREGARVFSAEDAEHLLQGKMADPLGAAVGGYLLLRAGQLERMHDWSENLAAWFPWLPDGLVVAGEKAARDGDHDRALDHFLGVREAGLPTFTDGYSFLLSRLRQYTTPDAATTLHGDVDGASKLLKRLLMWASFVDLSAPTLTFRGASVADPVHTQAPDQGGEVAAGLLLLQRGPELVYQQAMPA